MQIGFVSLGMGAQPLSDVLDLAQHVGAEALELNGRVTVHRDLWKPPVNYGAIKSAFEEAEVTPVSLGGYSSMAQPTDEGLERAVDEFVAYCERARQMGIPIVRAFAGDVVEGHTLEELYPRMVEGFKRVMQRIAGWDLTVGIENHGRLINHGEHLHSLVHEVGSPRLGITLDTGNFCWAGHSIETAHRFCERLAALTVNVHVKDGKFFDGEWTLFPAGRGDIDLAGILKTLRKAGYEGPVLSEYEGESDFRTSTLESVSYLRGLRDGLDRL
jgi:sugar phosphate isomerase/epimerase